MKDRTSTLATLAEDSCEFTRLLPRSDLMDAVLRGDEAAMRLVSRKPPPENSMAESASAPRPIAAPSAKATACGQCETSANSRSCASGDISEITAPVGSRNWRSAAQCAR